MQQRYLMEALYQLVRLDRQRVYNIRRPSIVSISSDALGRPSARGCRSACTVRLSECIAVPIIVGQEYMVRAQRESETHPSDVENRVLQQSSTTILEH